MIVKFTTCETTAADHVVTNSFRIAGLRPFGDPSRTEAWDIYEVPTITIAWIKQNTTTPTPSSA